MALILILVALYKQQDKLLQGTVIPRIGAQVWGQLDVDIGFAYGGIRLEGHLVQTSFPITISLTFSKFPIATV